MGGQLFPGVDAALLRPQIKHAAVVDLQLHLRLLIMLNLEKRTGEKGLLQHVGAVEIEENQMNSGEHRINRGGCSTVGAVEHGTRGPLLEQAAVGIVPFRPKGQVFHRKVTTSS